VSRIRCLCLSTANPDLETVFVHYVFKAVAANRMVDAEMNKTISHIDHKLPSGLTNSPSGLTNGSLRGTSGSAGGASGSLRGTSGSLRGTSGSLRGTSGSARGTSGSLGVTHGAAGVTHGAAGVTHGSAGVTHGAHLGAVETTINIHNKNPRYAVFAITFPVM
jgi:hypothetical protein